MSLEHSSQSGSDLEKQLELEGHYVVSSAKKAQQTQVVGKEAALEKLAAYLCELQANYPKNIVVSHTYASIAAIAIVITDKEVIPKVLEDIAVNDYVAQPMHRMGF